MTAALKFYFPSNGNDRNQDEFMEHMWNQGEMSYLIFVRRISSRGNPYIKGVFIVNDEDTVTALSEFECTQLSEEAFSCLVSELQEELSIEHNGVELGSY